MIEVWKDIEGYEGSYQISNKGRVKSLKRIVERKNGRKLDIKEKIIDHGNDAYGYPLIILTKNNVKKTKKVHRLVAIAFIDNPENKLCVNHIDGVKTNNEVYNLEWVTRKENSQHAKDIGLKNDKGESNPSSKLTELEVIEIRRLSKTSNLLQREIAIKFGVTRSTVSHILNRKTWQHI